MSPFLNTDKANPDADLGLAERLHQQAEVCGSTVAVEHGRYQLTYAELDRKALFLGDQINSLSQGESAPVGIIAPRSLDHVVSQVAVIYSGRACVPLDNRLPDEMLTRMLQKLGTSLVVTDVRQQHRLPSLRHLVVDHRMIPDPESVLSPSRNGPRARSFVFHTSGTTGEPKAVEGFAEGVISLCLDPRQVIRKGQRVGHACNIIFDVCVLDIWGSLLNGATMVVIPMDVVLDPTALGSFITEKELNLLQLPTSILAIMAHACPGALSTLDVLVTGGEAINCRSIQSIFDAGAPGRIINAYGPTEASVYMMYHEVSEEDARKGEIPVGRPFDYVDVFLVDDNLSPVQPGEAGELLISGVCVAGGYIGEPEKTAQSFVKVPQLGRKTPMYRTGDLMRVDEAGLYHFLGRKDNQIKVRGQRVELEALESTLLKTSLVSAAVVVKIKPEEFDRGEFLLAYCVPSSPDISAGVILKSYMEQAPHLMVPRLELIDVLPLQPTGKADRKTLEQRYRERLKRSQPKGDQADEAPPFQGNGADEPGDVASRLERIWITAFGLPVDHLKAKDDFVAMGGTSLMAATMIPRIHEAFGVSLRSQQLYENTSFDQLTHLVTDLQANGDDRAIQEEQQAWLQDSTLGQHLRPIEGTVPNWPDEGRIFLTGATGFVGIFLLAALARRSDVEKVACLVRAEDEPSARRRLEEALHKYSLSADMAKVIALPGHLDQAQLGLSPEEYDAYAEWSSVVFHLGAKVSYVAPYASHRQPNVLGTVHILDFCTHRRPKALHYSSTITSYGPTGYVTGAKLLPEDERPAAHVAALPYDMGYSQSQYVAEGLVWAAIDQGLPIAIYRPGFVLGESGICNPDDFISRLFMTCMDMGLYPILPGQRKEFVPVDFVVDAMLHISTKLSSLGHAYNLVHPHLDDAISTNGSFELLNELSPYQMRAIPYDQWVDALSGRVGDSMQPLTPMLRERVFDQKTRWEVWEHMPEYGRDNMRRALQDAPEVLNCRAIETVFQRSLQSWMPCCGRKSVPN
ncbi:NRPS-like enzyme [Aspergillus heteromorphus CBS 117.55]|uniref:NRPS-like enzyme n=1 Tax=Aspergillus heteromorphus CBS 117.55 TaxID=1448321 RepID=A0A317WV34_9EURO|nr:NRPS-like enzyme [Aspergillus heteromorphus CBS 117.55]PWY90216.1 NRPS-like enzyme [Aspergillus heteromorphus CBS 117.55]